MAPSSKKSVIRVLHVDDELCLLEVSKQILTMENSFEIENATSVDEAFKKMDKQQYDAIVSDYEMPKKNGLEFLKELRDQNNQIPFILFTGKGREDVAVKALNLGADSYINKNGSPETVYCELADAINKTVERKKSRELLAKSESKYHALVENSLQGISILLASPLRIVFANGAFGKILGYSSQELMSLSPEVIMGLVYHEDRAVFFKRMENRLRGEAAESCFEFRAVRKDGSIIWLSSLANRVEYDGQPAVQGMFLDINESKKMEEKLKANEKKYDTLVNATNTGYVTLDGKGLVLDANLEYVRLTGHKTLDQIKGRSVIEWTAKHDLKRNAQEVKKCYQEGFVRNLEIDYVDENGKITPVEINATVLGSEQDSVIVTLCRDITERKNAEEKLNEIISNDKFLADFVRNASVAIAVGYRDGRVGQFNLAFEKLTGYSEMELEKVSWSDMLTPPEWTFIEKTKLEELERTGKPVNYEKEYIRKDGSRVMIELSVHPVFDKNGKVMSYYAFINDISQRKRIESQLRESEAQFKQLFSNMPSAVAVYEAVNDGKNFAFRDFNAAAERIENIKKDKVIGKRVTEVFPGVENFGLFNVFKQVWQTGESEYYPLALYKDDKDLGTWRENWVYKLPNGNIVAIYNDISERKKAEEALVQEYNKFKSVTEAIGAGLAIINKDYHVLWANDFIKKYKGDVIGKLCYATLNSLDGPCQDCGVAKIFAGKTTFDSHEYCSTNIDGKLYWVEIVATPITDGHGNITSAVEIAIDITERKKAEEHRKVLERKVKNYSEHLKCMVDLRTAQLKDANERLIKSERLAAIGELAGMIGHDLRNPLAGIKNGVYFLKKKGTAISETQAKETLEIIDKAIDHSNKIINDLLDYSREMNLKLIKYAARPFVDEAIRSIQVPDRIQIVNHVDEEAFIWVDADKIIRVFVNLLQNAIDATPENGKLEINSCQPSNFVEIAFSDTGKGIPAEVLPKLFTPLFTTKAQGMGFGLAICKRIVEVHGGTIKVESVKDKGTKFIINLPVKM